MAAAAAIPVAARTFSRLLLLSSHSSSIGPAQNLSSFSTNLISRRPTPSLLSIFICNSTGFVLFSSSYSSTSYTTLSSPILSSSVSHHAAVIRGLIPPSPALNFLSASYSTIRDWKPFLRGSCLVDDIVPVIMKSRKTHWLFMMETDGFEFQTEQALFDYYIKTLVPVVGSYEEARKKIYYVSCAYIFGFGAALDKKTARSLIGARGVVSVLDDFSYKLREIKLGGETPARFNPRNWNHRLDDMFSYHHLSKYNSDWNLSHWLVHIQHPNDEFVSKQGFVDFCIRRLAEVVGSEEDAKKKIYIVWCKWPFGFGVEIDEQTLLRLKALPDVILVLPDYGFDVKDVGQVLVVSPSSRIKSDLKSYHFYHQPSLLHPSEDFEAGMEEPLADSVQSLACFTLMDHSRRLDNIYSYHHLSKRNSKWNFDHWLIIIKQHESGFTTEAQTLDFCVKILAEAIGSEQEAKDKIYIIWCKSPLGFGAEIDGETLNKIKGCPDVLKVLPDYAFDIKGKVTGALFVSLPSHDLRYLYYREKGLHRMDIGLDFRTEHRQS